MKASIKSSCWCVALRHRGSRLLQIAKVLLKKFYEFAPHLLWVWHMPGLSSTHCHSVICSSSQISAIHTSKISVWKLSPGMLSINGSAVSVRSVCCASKFGWNIFTSGGRSAKFAKLKIHKKVSPILAIPEDWHFWKEQLVLRSGLCYKRPTHIKRRPIGCSLQKTVSSKSSWL